MAGKTDNASSLSASACHIGGPIDVSTGELTLVSNHIFVLFPRVSEIEPKYYADGEDAYAMKRNLVNWAKQENIDPADPDSFFKTKSSDKKSQSSS